MSTVGNNSDMGRTTFQGRVPYPTPRRSTRPYRLQALASAALSAGVIACLSVVLLTVLTASPAWAASPRTAAVNQTANHAAVPTVDHAANQTAENAGYHEVASDGGIFSFGDAQFYGSMGGTPLNKPIVGMAATPNGQGYWEVASDGGIFSFGDAQFYGSMGGTPLNKPIVGMAATPDGKGYWEVASDGGIFSFGDAQFYGSMGGTPLNKPIVGMAATPNGQGYWEVASDGGIFSFGNAGFYGSMGGTPLNKPIVGMAATPNGQGYWEVASDGGIFSFGNAQFYGSMGGTPLNKPILGMAAVPGGGGYWEVASDGGIFSFGDAQFYGSMGGTPLNKPIVGIAATPPAESPSTPSTPPATQSTLTVTTYALPAGQDGTRYSASLSASGGTPPYSWATTAGALPPGLTLSSGGTISGTPMSTGTYDFTVQVTDSSTPTPHVASQGLSISVSPTAVETPTAVEDSTNWSGYAVTDGPYTSVTGTFTVTSLDSSDTPSENLVEWVGIDGFNDRSLVQAGVQEEVDPYAPSGFIVKPWWEIIPAPATYITTMTVSPGDQVTVTITKLSTDDWSITLKDDTSGESFNTDQTYDGPATSAEWIVEAPTIHNTQSPLAPYSPDVEFTDLGVNGTESALDEVIMMQNGYIVSDPSALTSAGFNVAYGGTPAPNP